MPVVGVAVVGTAVAEKKLKKVDYFTLAIRYTHAYACMPRSHACILHKRLWKVLMHHILVEGI